MVFEHLWDCFNLKIQRVDSFSCTCHNLSLGLATQARGYKVVGQEGDPGVTSCAFENVKNVREWTLTLPNELPGWELESQMDSRLFRAWLHGSKPIVLKSFLYYWKNIEMKSQLWEFRDSHLGILRQKTISMWPSWRGAKYIIRRESGGFPQIWAVVNLVSLRLLVPRPNTKSAPIMH
jgi:hypothetical protein